MIPIIDLPAGECVPGPGFYRTPLEHYHSQAICPGFSISSSGLRTVYSVSPWAFWATHEANPARWIEPEKDHFNIGRAAHALILGDEIWEANYAVRPTEWDSWRTKASQEWRAEQALLGKTIVTPEQVIAISRMGERIIDCPEARAALTSEHFEISMIWQDVTGIWVKSRMDSIPSNGFDFADLKTFAPSSKNLMISVQRSITDYRYDMQMALGIEGVERLAGGSADNCILIFGQTTMPHHVIPIRIEHDTLYWARCCNRAALDTVAKCIETGIWPGVSDGIATYSLPPSLTARYAEMQANGELPNIGETA